MRVTLVATNMELGPLESAVRQGRADQVTFSPEPIAAAYARISRSPKTVEELREEARQDVEKARRSNENIVFEMGHASIAEHAVFNFDIEGISRLAIEELERTRLASYTERSQRYVLLGKDYVVPPELEQSDHYASFLGVVERLTENYHQFYQALLDAHILSRPNPSPPSRKEMRELENLAKEDARYVLPLCTTGQLGLTINARSLEETIRRLHGSRLQEVRQLGDLLEERAREVTPSLIRYTAAVKQPFEAPLWVSQPSWEKQPTVRLLDATPDGDRKMAEALALLTRQPGSPSGLEAMVDDYYGDRDPHLRAPRLFELVDMTFEVTVSAACYAQLKRHRMATMLAGPYDLSLGVCVPPEVRAAGLEPLYRKSCAAGEQLALELAGRRGDVAAYCLTNGHQRRVIVKMNLRELYHFSRLRMDQHAQWEIRSIAGAMVDHAVELFPATAGFLCGKHQVGEHQKRDV